MNHQEASNGYAHTIGDIDQAIQALQALAADPGGPLSELVARQLQIQNQIVNLATQRQHAVTQKANVDLVIAAGNAATPIDPARAAAVSAALLVVSNAVAQMNEFHQALAAAAAIANAVSQT